MMPHPERAADAAMGSTDGRLIFDSLLLASRHALARS
jgi:phosphoribosylformylglycinamidine (FGAM) synthase-like amidotransferase family enzyme